jgi:hypothetical protein
MGLLYTKERENTRGVVCCNEILPETQVPVAEREEAEYWSFSAPPINLEHGYHDYTNILSILVS